MLWAMIKKEFLLVSRDKHALLALFVMPAIFILVMSVALKEQFNQDAISFHIEIKDEDKTKESAKFIKKLFASSSFSLDEESAELRITIPKSYYDLSRKNQNLDIVVLGSLKGGLLEVFKAKLLKVVMDFKLDQMSKKIKKTDFQASKAMKKMSLEYVDLYNISYENKEYIPSSTQQSVPSWIVFGMFFVIIPMSTIFINERKQNTLQRLTTMNVSIFKMTLAKIVPYLVINHIQVWIMLGVGVFIVPFFDTPALEVTGSFMAIEVLSFGLSLSAIGLSVLIAVSATSAEQATTIGGISNILLGAIGGVMVPKFIMPESMQTLANISPMSWGLDGFLDIFMKSADISMVAYNASLLALFGLVALSISMIILKIRISRGL
ncbi:ABC transporter permease [Sulfurimonas sp. SAG-AH-194-C21]|nr:ABC transporter permease [Sulfurimonas sp. SAG-AH-194-C21]MDF1883126.1 ABC transporter permease [Sulfurimonas sp. SAG-AH-194-C21]